MKYFVIQLKFEQRIVVNFRKNVHQRVFAFVKYFIARLASLAKLLGFDVVVVVAVGYPVVGC